MNCKKFSTSKTMAVSLFLSFCFVLLSSVSSTSVAKATKDTLFVGDYLQDGQTLVSSGRRFEFGFFSPGNSSNRYLGIWYKNVPLTVVWIANKDYPITDHSGELMLTSGDGVSLNNVTHCIWNIRPKRLARSPVLQILDSGNLVLRDGMSGNDPEGYMWQSFDFPCNTLLPGMKLGWNMRTGSGWFMTSWKSADDPSRGDFVFGMENIEMPQLVLRKGWTKESRWGPWDGTRFSGSKELNANPILKSVFTFNAEEVSYTFSVTDNSILVMLVVNQQGLVQYLIWRNHTNEWIPLVNLQTDNCDRYGVCGPYGSCYKDDPECSCLEGFTPSSPQAWSIMDWSDGCTRKWELDCKNGDGFVKYEGLKLPDNSHLWTNKILSHQECEAECLKNCSCMAYTNLDIYGNGSYCVMWSGDLVDMRTSTEDSTEIIYIRMARKELDSIADARRKKLVEKIAIIFLAAVTVMLLVGVIGWCTLHIMKKVRQVPGVGASVTDYVEESAVEDLELPYFDMVTISAATNHFASDNKIGQGGFGTVYKGVLPDGQEIAVKRLSKNSGQGLEEFKNEVILIANLQHRNLVKLLGCCIQGEERMLIYEYLPNKSLDNFLFDQTRRKLLPWRKRFSIAIGVARGLLYLHQDSRLRIIHRDLKTSNILLDADMNPKISDFGVARIFGGDQTEEVTKRVIGTYGYMSPEYALSGLFSVKSDVFSFGVVLLEIISGKKNWGFSHPDHDLNLIGHAWKLWNEGNPLEMMDVEMEQSFCIDEVLRCIQVGLLCVQQRAEDRPMVSSVVIMLRNESSELPPPKEPGFCAESSSTGIDALPESNNKDKRTVVIISVSVAFGALLLASFGFGWFLIWKRTHVESKAQRQRVNNPNQDDKPSVAVEEEDLELPLFDLYSIATATNNFSFTNKIGEGGFGPVYKGELPSGEQIAVKRLSRYSGQGLKEFKNEVILIAKLQHRNLVRLLGCCIHGEDRMLIYEFLPNRSLDLYTFNQTRGTSLDWQKRFDIIVGVARGLLYLHRDSRLRIIHRDLKASNILLDSEMNPKISDFGLARTFRGDQTEANTSRIIGTYGYMSPEYAIDGLFSVKSDVFSFGVLVLEIVSGKKNRGFYHPDHDFNLLGHAWNMWNENRTMELMDALMEKPIPASEVLRCIQVSLLCVQQSPEDRPTISSVLLMLDSENSSLPEPKQPGFYTERSVTETDSLPTGKSPYTANELTITMLQGR